LYKKYTQSISDSAPNEGYDDTKEMAEMLFEEDVRNYSEDKNEFRSFIERVNNMSFDGLQTVSGKDIEEYLEVIMSSPKENFQQPEPWNFHGSLIL